MVGHAAEQLEHAEHTAHVHGKFEIKVAVTMAIIAAVLAALHSLEHHLHGDSLEYAIKAGTKSTEASNKWSHYQAKSNRGHQDEVMAKLLDVLPKGSEEKLTSLKKELMDETERYKTEKKEIQVEAEKLTREAGEFKEKSHHYHELSIKVGWATLALELGLVICSLAVLTKKKFFWVTGILLGVGGAIFGLYIFLTQSGLLKQTSGH